MGIFDKIFGRTRNFNIWGNISDQNGYEFKRIDKGLPIQSYLGNDAVYSVVHKIALNGGTLPYKVLKNDTEIYDDYFDFLENPNKEQSRVEFMYRCFTNFSLTGDLYILKEETSIGFGVDKMVVLPSQRAECIRVDENNFLSDVDHYEFTVGNEVKTYKPEEIIHLKYYDPSIEGLESNNGLSPLQPGQYVIESNNNLTTAESSMLGNRGASNLISGGDSQYGLAPKEKDDLDKALKNRIGGSKNFNKSVVVGSEVKVHKLDMSPSDLKIIESYPNQLRRICTLFSMPAELFNAEGSGQFNTRKEALKSSYTEAIIPIAELIYAAIDRGLNKGYKQEVNKSKIDALNPSKEEQVTNWITMYDKGLLSRETFLELSGITDEGVNLKPSATISITNEGLSNDALEGNNAAEQAKITAQANLRGSVGGVQGILAIQASVSQGTTSIEAALTTLIEIYGFDEETAKKILG